LPREVLTAEQGYWTAARVPRVDPGWRRRVGPGPGRPPSRRLTRHASAPAGHRRSVQSGDPPSRFLPGARRHQRVPLQRQRWIGSYLR